MDQYPTYDDEDDNMHNSKTLKRLIKSSFAKDSQVTESGTKIRWEIQDGYNHETSSTNRSSDGGGNY